ncbi:COR domain-containing protein [Candidatus Albibeggiatoa sp. nov. BB20]|uniref:COR domain-containing protein n=1 Tax=Candidatus Albibeggiatoa sp. nov. BB20 TaxID=3162723 RepID=UPI003365807C
MKKLKILDLGENKLKKLPKEIGELQNLEKLQLWKNKLEFLPNELGKLHSLFLLGVGENQLKYLPNTLGELQNLSILQLWKNNIKGLPSSIGNLKKLKELHISNTPLQKLLPIEIKTQNTKAIIDYFNSLQQERPLNEIKILLVGDGGAGKTSLLKQLKKQSFDEYESQTHGINIQSLTVHTQNKQQDNIEVNGHLWDFGGQEVMHATHQFFLSKRSLYILVLDGRKEEKTEYWLKHIESFGEDSPVLVVLNKIDENPSFEVNQPFLREKYAGIHSFHRISCKNKMGFDQLQQSISKALIEVEILQTVWGQSWFEVKKNLENLTKHYISHENYKNLCKQQKIEKSAQDTLVQFLHDLGVIIHFKDFDLRDTYVLEPKWVTEAVYKIINAPQLAKSYGILKLEWLDEILEPKNENDYKYPIDKHRYIILLMEKFELCYKICKQTILIPDLLPVAQPTFDFNYDNALKFKLEYDFLPRSIMPKFIVKRNTDILNQLQWRTGVVLYDKTHQATAVIKADNEDRNIQIWVTGQQKRDYFATIRKTLSDLHNEFEKLNVIELVPLPDKDKREQTVYVEYEELIGLYLDNETIFRSGKLRKKYNIRQLLDGIIDMNDPQQVNPQINVYGNVHGSNLNAGDHNEQNIRKNTR